MNWKPIDTIRCALPITWVLCPLMGDAAPILHEFDLGRLAEAQPSVCAVTPTHVPASTALVFTPAKESDALELWNGSPPLDWTEAEYLVCEVWHTNISSAILYFDFYRRKGRGGGVIEEQGGQLVARVSGGPRISPKIGVLPTLPTQVIIPLSYLDGQEIFLPRFPRQLKGTVMGRRLDPTDIGALRLRLAPVQLPEHASTLTILRAYLTNELPPPLPAETTSMVDEFGQWARRDWPGKVPSEAVLKNRFQQLEARAGQAAFPTNWSRYGGWMEKRFEAKGFFRTHHDGQRWWLVDPDGYAFLSAGMDCVGANTATPVAVQEDLFAWLPSERRRGGVDFFQANLERVYGTAWRAPWERLTTGLLTEAGFNTIANWSDLDYARRAQRPYVLPMRSFPGTRLRLYRDFPDVFAAEYEENAQLFARQLQEFREDPFLIGYFLVNEPHWAFGRNNLAFEMFTTRQASETKRAFGRWIEQHYGSDLGRFNEAWDLALPNFAALLEHVFRDPPSPRAEEDFWEFSGLMAERYVDVPCDAVKAVDPNHLNLGMRYAWVSSDLLYRAGQRFDVFSINGYSFPGPPDTAEVARRSGKPVMIGEFHFGATDRGLPATGIQGVASQADRATAYRYYVEQGFQRPELIGIHYFQWLDQAVTGRFDGENYNIGFLDICHQPYPELMAAARETHERLYPVATGLTPPYSVKPRKAPAVYY